MHGTSRNGFSNTILYHFILYLILKNVCLIRWYSRSSEHFYYLGWTACYCVHDCLCYFSMLLVHIFHLAEPLSFSMLWSSSSYRLVVHSVAKNFHGRNMSEFELNCTFFMSLLLRTGEEKLLVKVWFNWKLRRFWVLFNGLHLTVKHKSVPLKHVHTLHSVEFQY